MRKLGWLSVMLLACSAAACGGGGGGGGGPPVDNDVTPAGDSSPGDDVTTPSDVRDGGGTDARVDVRTDAAVPTDGPASRAGAPCTMPDPMGGEDPACGDTGLVCVNSQTTPVCSGDCMDNSSQAMEREQCGGNGSTCLTQGDGDTANSLCTASCRVAAMTTAAGACRPGNVCTGWWYTHQGARPDSTGCFPFCSENSHCGMGQNCHVRLGSCGTRTVDMTKLPDGSPCNPMMTEMVPGEMRARNNQCRGICFLLSSTDRTQGICGSFVNLRAASACPDDPDSVQPLAPMGADNLGICLFRTCRTNADCRSPHICRYEEQMGMPATDGPTVCQFPTAAQRTGIPAGDGGVADGGTDAAMTGDGGASAACMTCGTTMCGTELAACAGNAGCAAWGVCTGACPTTPGAARDMCFANCDRTNPRNAQVNALVSCTQMRCGTVCPTIPAAAAGDAGTMTDGGGAG